MKATLPLVLIYFLLLILHHRPENMGEIYTQKTYIQEKQQHQYIPHSYLVVGICIVPIACIYLWS